MTSPKKVAANWLNGRKSRGPRTSAGKARASRNARRHGLAAFSSKDDPVMVEQIEQMVNAICADDDDPLLRQQAGMIAENQLWLSCVKAEKVALIERLRDPTAFALSKDTSLAQAKIADAPFRQCCFSINGGRRPNRKRQSLRAAIPSASPSRQSSKPPGRRRGLRGYLKMANGMIMKLCAKVYAT